MELFVGACNLNDIELGVLHPPPVARCLAAAARAATAATYLSTRRRAAPSRTAPTRWATRTTRIRALSILNLSSRFEPTVFWEFKTMPHLVIRRLLARGVIRVSRTSARLLSVRLLARYLCKFKLMLRSHTFWRTLNILRPRSPQ